MSQIHTLHRGRRYHLGDYAGNYIFFTCVSDWASRVVANGGAAVSAATLVAVNSFAGGLIADGLLTDNGGGGKIRALNFYAPDNLIASITPFIVGGGNDPWTNHNFISANLTVNGLIGNTSSAYLDTGIVPNAAILTTSSAGLLEYVTAASSAGVQGDFSVYGSATNSLFGIYTQYNTNLNFFGCWRFDNTPSASLTWTEPSPATGFYSAQRTASNAGSVYFANSGQAFTTLASFSGAAAIGAIETTFKLYAFADNSAGTAANFSGKRFSLHAVTGGLTLSDSQNFYNRFQAFRTTLGGGFV